MAEAETKEAHTPGPWMVVNTDRRNDWGAGLRAGHRSRVMLIESPFTSVVTNRGVARPASSEGAANARLIAASPDLLAFAKALDASWSETFPEGPDADYSNSILNIADEHKALWRQCRAAIQRAEA